MKMRISNEILLHPLIVHFVGRDSGGEGLDIFCVVSSHKSVHNVT